MAAFLKRGAPAVHKTDKPKPDAKEHTSANLVGAMERHGMGSAIASKPTSEMKKELEAAGVVLGKCAAMGVPKSEKNELAVAEASLWRPTREELFVLGG